MNEFILGSAYAVSENHCETYHNIIEQEAQLPQRNSASAAQMEGGGLGPPAVQPTPPPPPLATPMPAYGRIESESHNGRSLWLWWVWSYLAPFSTYGDLLAKNCLFLLPLSHSAPSLPMFPLVFKRAVRKAHFKMNRTFKVILIGAGWNPEWSVVVMCN